MKPNKEKTGAENLLGTIARKPTRAGWGGVEGEGVWGAGMEVYARKT